MNNSVNIVANWHYSSVGTLLEIEKNTGLIRQCYFTASSGLCSFLLLFCSTFVSFTRWR